MHRLMLCCNELTRYALQRTPSISLDGRTRNCPEIGLAINAHFFSFGINSVTLVSSMISKVSILPASDVVLETWQWLKFRQNQSHFPHGATCS